MVASSPDGWPAGPRPRRRADRSLFAELTVANFTAIADQPIWSESIVNSLLIAGVGALLTTAAIAVVSVAARSSYRFRGSLRQAVVRTRRPSAHGSELPPDAIRLFGPA